MLVKARRCLANLLAMTVTLSLLPGNSSARSRMRGRSSGDLVTEDPVGDIRHVLPELNLENNTVIDVKVNVGDVAYLPCRFPQLSTLHQVSWIRRWDWHILTTGIYTYTSDMRFNVLHTEGSDDWTLQLKYVNTRDNGTYECQMYTGTGVLSQFVNLHVHTPRAAILGPQELHVQEGDTITLICVIQQSKPPFVFWYHGENMVNYDGSRHHLNVITKVEGTRTHSRLTITDARHTDSGNYSCIPPNVEPAYVLVFVTEKGDTVAAVQRRGHASASDLPSPSSASVSLVVSLLCTSYALWNHFLPVR
ncbi:transmembrane and immunoglobulin domain-containing protein 1 [Procambarus clarkii]|uniref:transmembrane and immunoglobulin domain-containing protein 1 n=1 Tax=Procambarus clarkii TaxID=6728 RepID=UPI001E6701B4|nr:hemicentin-1-like [Procambarus clarkii]XP_045621451.1 hemicentin-1-like [Procambarus clarkii]